LVSGIVSGVKQSRIVTRARNELPCAATITRWYSLAITRKNPGYRVFQAFAARRPDIIGPAPKLYLFAAPSPYCIVFVETAKDAIITLVESPVAYYLQIGCAEFGENQLQGMLRTNKIGSEGAVEEITLGFEASPGGARFFYPFEGEIGVFPAGEKVLVIPLALAVSQQHENAIHVSARLDVRLR
jgi:hypothetical protein